MERPGAGRQRRDAGQRAGHRGPRRGVVPPAGHGHVAGPIVCTVSGSTQRHGVGEFAMGTPLRDGASSRSAAVSAAGRRSPPCCAALSGAPVLPEQLDLPLTYEDFAAAGLGPRVGQLHRRRRRGADGPDRRRRRPTSWRSRAAGSASRASATAWRSTSCSTTARGTGGRSPHGSTRSTAGRAARSPDRPSGSSARSSPWPRWRRAATHWDDEVNAIVPLVEIVEGRAVLDVASLAKRADWSYPEDGPESGRVAGAGAGRPAGHGAGAHTPEPADDADVAEGHPGRGPCVRRRCSPRIARWRSTSTSCAGRRPATVP